MVEAAGGIGILNGNAEIVIGDGVEFIFIAGYKMPFLRIDLHVFGVRPQFGLRIAYRIDRMRQQQDVVVFEVTVVDSQHLLGHLRTDGGATQKEKIDQVGLAGKGFVGDGITQLIGKSELSYPRVDRVALYDLAVSQNG